MLDNKIKNVNGRLILRNEDYEKVIQIFKNTIENFDEKLTLLREEWDIEYNYSSSEFLHFMENLLPNYCIEKIEEEDFNKVQDIFKKIEEVLINYPDSEIENSIGVCFLENLWGNFYEYHEKFIGFSGKKTLELTMKINWIFYHKEESNQKILKKLERL